jgi:hypothetical protein
MLLLVIGCNKTKTTEAACSPQICTAIFASVGIHFTDKNGQPINVQNFQVIDLRTSLTITSAHQTATVGSYTIVDDGDLKKLSTDGDDLQVSATNAATGETKTTIIKVAGGCTCHVSKVSGADTVMFN